MPYEIHSGCYLYPFIVAASAAAVRAVAISCNIYHGTLQISSSLVKMRQLGMQLRYDVTWPSLTTYTPLLSLCAIKFFRIQFWWLSYWLKMLYFLFFRMVDLKSRKNWKKFDFQNHANPPDSLATEVTQIFPNWQISTQSTRERDSIQKLRTCHLVQGRIIIFYPLGFWSFWV